MQEVRQNNERKINLHGRINLVVAILFSLCVFGTTVQAATPEPVFEGDIISVEPVETLSHEELVDLVGRIALYPDDLVAIILPASTYPLQIVEAARLREKDDASLEPNEDWDESVVALLNYPEALALLNEDLTWTWSLGQAVLSQQDDVMSAISEFRQLAYDAGNLKSDDRQVVATYDDTVTIKQADPEVIYVPYYEPEEVLVHQPRTVYYYYSDPYPVYYYPYGHHRYYTNYFWGINSFFGLSWNNQYVHHYTHDHYRHPYYGHNYHRSHFNRTHRYNRPVAHNRRMARHNYSGQQWQDRRDWRPEHGRTGMRPNRSQRTRAAGSDSQGTQRQRRHRGESNRGANGSGSASLAYGQPIQDPNVTRNERSQRRNRGGEDRQRRERRNTGQSAADSTNPSAGRRPNNRNQAALERTRSTVHRDAARERNAVSGAPSNIGASSASPRATPNIPARTRRQIEQINRLGDRGDVIASGSSRASTRNTRQQRAGQTSQTQQRQTRSNEPSRDRRQQTATTTRTQPDVSNNRRGNVAPPSTTSSQTRSVPRRAPQNTAQQQDRRANRQPVIGTANVTQRQATRSPQRSSQRQRPSQVPRRQSSSQPQRAQRRSPQVRQRNQPRSQQSQRASETKISTRNAQPKNNRSNRGPNLRSRRDR